MNIEVALKNLDNPIQSVEEDLLQRRGFVENLCHILAAAPREESNVFALYGEWGSGKTSVKNLLKLELQKQGKQASLPIEFNPWAFSGQDQVLEAFFTEVGKVIESNPKGKQAAEGFKKLGAYLSFGSKTVNALHLGMDLFGIPGSKIVGLVGQHLGSGSKQAKRHAEDLDVIGKVSLEQLHRELKKALSKFGRPLLIVLDDLDRLTPEQLLLMFQIVKINASLPNVNYLLLMDKDTVQRHLKVKEVGPEYLEKIVQFDFTLPYVGEAELKQLLKEGFKSVMGRHAEEVDWQRWDDAWTNGCQNIFTTLRRIKRFLHTYKFHIALFANEDVLEVDPVDLFLVEVLRKFAPEVHSEVPRILAESIYQRRWMERLMWQKFGEETEFGQIDLERALKLAPQKLQPEVRHILRLMFPQLEDHANFRDEDKWIRSGRICHELFFESYFRLAIPRQLPTQKEIKSVFDSASNGTLLRNRLKELYGKVGLHALLVRIQSHHAKLKPGALPTFLAELWRLDEENARTAGAERAWETRSDTQDVSRFLIANHCPVDQRVQILVQATRDSGTVYPAVRVVAVIKRELEERPHSKDHLFEATELDQVRRTILDEVHRFADAGTLLDSPDSGDILFAWARLESQDAVREFLTKQMKDETRIPLVLSRFIFKSITSGSGETKVHYYISRKALEILITLDDRLETTLKGMGTMTLPQWERFAVEETLKRIEEKKKGIQEAEYRE